MKFTVLGFHKSNDNLVVEDIVRVRIFIDDKFYDEDLPSPKIPTVEELLVPEIESRAKALQASSDKTGELIVGSIEDITAVDVKEEKEVKAEEVLKEGEIIEAPINE